jgi:hypothetical protein
LRPQLDEGARCPLCTQRAQRYRRKINSTMARTLIALHRHSAADEFVHVPSLGRTLRIDIHECSQLLWWGLVEEQVAVRPDGGRRGYYRLTPFGRRFIAGTEKVAKVAVIYDSDVQYFDGPQVDIHDCLGARFDLRELMNGTP